MPLITRDNMHVIQRYAALY